MATSGGPNVPEIGNVPILIDPANLKNVSFDRDNNILNYSTWQLNGTSASGFSRNGNSGENKIISGTGPWGETTLLWRAIPDSTSNADGGWNTSSFSIDKTKLYRFSVWVKRTVYVDGRFYFGTRGYGSTSGLYRRNNGSNQTNPYFWTSSDPPTTSQLPNSTWVLVVGHVWPFSAGNGSNHPDSGRYTVNGRFGGISYDYRWRNETTTTVHRTYLYYSSNTSPRQYWVYPRVDLVDGTEPSIDDLLSGKTRYLENKVAKSQNFFLSNKARIREYSGLAPKFNEAIDLDGTDDYIDLGSDILYKTGGGWTVETVVNFDSIAGSYNNVTSPSNFIGSDSIDYNSWYWSVLDGKLALWNRSPGIWKYGSTTLSTNKWYHTTLVCNDAGTSYQMYLNGIAEGGDHTTYSWNPSYAGLKIRYIGRGNSTNVRQINGKIGYFKVTKKALSSKQVYRSFNAIRKRFKI